MFCYQCEQAAKGTGCDIAGVCGKQPDVAALQDFIIYQTKGISYLAYHARKLGITDDEVNRHTIEALFSTVTNVNFDTGRLEDIIYKGEKIRIRAGQQLREAARAGFTALDETQWPIHARTVPCETTEELIAQGAECGIFAEMPDPDIRSLDQILIYGLKGMAAYADHALVLGRQDETVFAYIHEALAALCDNNRTAEKLTGLVMKCGEVNIRCMELLDQAHTGRFGHPQPTVVSTGRKKGPAIIISGHDLLDIEELLKQTRGTGVQVYTHGEMLPAHGYPGLKKYEHLAGHFGAAWQNQQREFDGVPAAILFTTNCIQKPRDSYKANVFTCGLVAWPGVPHVKGRDYSAVIKRAIALGGFEQTDGGTLLTGCGHNAVLSVADKVIDAVKTGAVKHFFVIGGCDGTKPGRNYYTELAERIPKDSIILTLACGKFRFNNLDFGTIGGIPRLLDIGQCNDTFSAIKIAQALAGAFNCGVNELPLSIVLSWYEQKAVAVLLSLLSLGIKGIRIGPSLPAFISPNILAFLVKTFDLKPIKTAQEDLETMLSR